MRLVVILQMAIFGLLWTAAVDARTFKISTLAQEGTAWMNIMKGAGSKIRADTDGRVKFKFYGGGVMGNDAQVLRKIRAGQLQGAALGTGALVRFYTDLELYNLPMVFRNYGEVDYIRTRFDKRIQAGLEQAGFVSFGFAEGGFAYAMTKKSASTVEAIRKQKVWTPTDDAGALRAMQAFGISPIPLGLADVLLALQADTVNAVAGPAHAALALQWHTQVKYLINLPLLYTYATLAVDKKPFNTMEAADQVLVRQHMSTAFQEIDRINRQDQEAALAALKNQGIEFISPNPEATALWQTLAQKAVMLNVDAGLVDPVLYGEMQTQLLLYRQNSQ